MLKSKVISLILCAALLSGSAVAQNIQPQDSDQLRKNIERVEAAAPTSNTPSVQLRYKEVLLPLYDRYVSALEQDLSDLRKLRSSLDAADADAVAKLDADIARAAGHLSAARVKAGQLCGETPAPSGAGAAAPASIIPASITAQAAPAAPDDTLPGGCPKSLKDIKPYGLIWCKTGEAAGKSSADFTDYKLSLQELAEVAAPILWFSPDEPQRYEKAFPPHPLPGDRPGTPVVYYRVTRLVLYPSSGISEGTHNPYPFTMESDTVELNRVKELTIKYYLYYRRDVGMEGHRHDLESVRMDFRITARGPGAGRDGAIEDPWMKEVSQYEIRVNSVLGAAHGIAWYDNELELAGESDVSLPITILVEEGKHASTPDRNADGVYSPGYDVNRRYADAWGPRDTLRTGQLGSPKYEAYMSKPRAPEHMVMVEPQVASKSSLLAFYRGKHKQEVADLLKGPDTHRRYQLRRIGRKLYGDVMRGLPEDRDARMKVESGNKKEELAKNNKGPTANQKELAKFNKELAEKLFNEDKLIVSLMEREKFHNDKKPSRTHGAGTLERFWRKGLGIRRGEEFRDALTFAGRFEGGRYGFSISPPVGRYEIPFLGGYALPRFNIMTLGPDRRFGAEALYTPSAARAFDWYAATGMEWLRPQPGQDFEAQSVVEGGIRVRFRKKQLMGFRLGLRATDVKNPRDPRLVFEFGTGAF